VERAFADEGLRLSHSGAVARLTLNRPEARNALTFAMWRALPEVAEMLASDRNCRVLVLTGKGEKAFSAGADIAEFPETYATPETARNYNAAVRSAQAAISELPFPVIAEIRGVCFGGGCGLAMHADLRFAAHDATFAITPAKLGLAYSFADTRRLVSLAGPAHAKDILFSGRVLSAKEALRIGLIDRAVAPEDLCRTVDDYSQTLSHLSATSIRLAKATIEAISRGETEASDELRRDFEAAFGGPDFTEGYSAFMEKRKPDFG